MTNNGYAEALAFTQSEDRLILAGAAIRPTVASPQPVTIVWIHGNTGTFYDQPYVYLGRALARKGYCFVTGNTRGHDISATLWQMPEDVPVAGGSGWERLEEASFDLAAWVDFAYAESESPIVLIGHSQGAAKAILYQAERQDPRVAGIGLASPDLHGHWPAELVALARDHLAAGRGSTLLYPLPDEPWYALSAANLASRDQVLMQVYTRVQREPMVAQVACPILVFFGTLDCGGSSELVTIQEAARRAPQVTTQIIDGADHVYSNHTEQVADVIERWIAGLSDGARRRVDE